MNDESTALQIIGIKVDPMDDTISGVISSENLHSLQDLCNH
jgi:hypothetical protein